MHSCGSTVDSLDDLAYSPPPVQPGTIQEEKGNTCGQNSILHHEMEKNIRLGTEVFQQRTIVITSGYRTSARNVVRDIPYRIRDKDQNTFFTELNTLFDYMSRVYIAQAEYYYDTGYDEKKGRPEQDPNQWLWHMSWRARLRRVRMPRKEQRPTKSQRQLPSKSKIGACSFEPPASDLVESCRKAGGSAKKCPKKGFLDELKEYTEGLMIH